MTAAASNPTPSNLAGGPTPYGANPAKPFVDVAAGVLIRPDGRILLAERPADKPWSGWWELPGGKIEAGETVLQALARELTEELGIQVTEAAPWVTYIHEYPKNVVRLAFCRVTAWRGQPQGIEGQRLEWVDPAGPHGVGPLLPATEPPLRWLTLPDRYLITGIGGAADLPAYLDRLEAALDAGIRLVQFREPGVGLSPGQRRSAFEQVLACCRRHAARCLVNSAHPPAWWEEADGVHLRAADARRLSEPAADAAAADLTGSDALAAPTWVRRREQRNGRLVAVSAHDAQDLQAARHVDADFAVLGHVLDTPSHAGEPGMGWERFAAEARYAGLPVLAIGGQSAATLATAQRHGAHGIAGIRWPMSSSMMA